VLPNMAEPVAKEIPLNSVQVEALVRTAWYLGKTRTLTKN
jgi:hypothetical protein